MILIINICKQELHRLEFVKPIEDILSRSETPFTTKHFSKFDKKDLDSCHRIIITGTSLKDFDYAKHLSKFNFLKSFDKPVLAICGGMQLLCMIHGCKLEKFREIGLKPIKFNAEFLGVTQSRESENNNLDISRDVYCLHNMAVKNDAILKKNFNIYSTTTSSDGKQFVQAIKHKHFKHYGTLFHPEVRNKDLIVNFLYV